VEITEKIKDASRIMGLPVLDHLIISRNGYFSFVEHGLLKVETE
jgi:DNA repair protein RadC